MIYTLPGDENPELVDENFTLHEELLHIIMDNYLRCGVIVTK